MMFLQESRCNLLSCGETKIECDEKCRELKEEEEKAKARREAAIKEEEMKKQQVDFLVFIFMKCLYPRSYILQCIMNS